MNTEILSVHHKADPQLPLFKDIFAPIQVGTGDDLGVLRDNTGQNIAHLNPYFCELTALYWRWHTPPTDRVGLVHYRRLFVLAQTPRHRRKIIESQMEYRLRLGLRRLNLRSKRPEGHVRLRLTSPDAIRTQAAAFMSWIKAHPNAIVLPRPVPFSHDTVPNIYAQGHHRKDLEDFLDILSQKSPALRPEIDAIDTVRHYYICNMFVFPWEVFDLYCQMLFPALLALHDRRDMTLYDPYQARVFGFLAERFMGLFAAYLKRQGGGPITHMPMAFCDLPAQSVAAL